MTEPYDPAQHLARKVEEHVLVYVAIGFICGWWIYPTVIIASAIKFITDQRRNHARPQS